MKDNKKTYNLIYNEEIPLMINARILGMDCTAIVDTGSQISFIDWELIRWLRLTPQDSYNMNIGGWNSDDEMISNEYRPLIKLRDDEGKEQSYPFLCNDMDMTSIKQRMKNKGYDHIFLIIGADWLNDAKAKIDMKSKTMTISSPYITDTPDE